MNSKAIYTGSLITIFILTVIHLYNFFKSVLPSQSLAEITYEIIPFLINSIAILPLILGFLLLKRKIKVNQLTKTVTLITAILYAYGVWTLISASDPLGVGMVFIIIVLPAMLVTTVVTAINLRQG